MTATKLIAQIEGYGVRLREKGGTLHVIGKPKQDLRWLIGTHRDEILSALRGHDVELSIKRGREFLESVGAFQLPIPMWSEERGNFVVLGRWTHNLGDEHLDRILCGEISFEDAKAAAIADRKAVAGEAIAFARPSTRRWR